MAGTVREGLLRQEPRLSGLSGPAGVKVVVLDRPNPIGGVQIEGGGLDPGLENFCGLYGVPQRHALTLGELARLYK